MDLFIYCMYKQVRNSVKLDHEFVSDDSSVMRKGWYPIPRGSGNITITTHNKNNEYDKWGNFRFK